VTEQDQQVGDCVYRFDFQAIFSDLIYIFEQKVILLIMAVSEFEMCCELGWNWNPLLKEKQQNSSLHPSTKYQTASHRWAV